LMIGLLGCVVQRLCNTDASITKICARNKNLKKFKNS